MNVLIIGYGKMGELIEKVLLQKAHKVYSIIDINDSWPDFKITGKPDIAIEFTKPEAVLSNLRKCMKEGIPIVTGTTGWNSDYEQIRSECENLNTAVLYASNFSIGVNLWFDLIKDAAKRFSSLSQYDLSLKEKHHIHKLDKPSGTAITSAEFILKAHQSYSSWSMDEKKDSLKVEAFREGEIKGFHELCVSSDFDQIKISHEAINRDGFALGAVKAAEWLIDKKGFFDFHEVYKEVFEKDNITY